METTWRTTRPSPTEHAPYYGGYIAEVPDGDVLDTMTRQLEESLSLWRSVPPDKADFAYAEGKWTVKGVMAHIIDAERVFAYRALRAARGDATPLPGFDENAYAKTAPARSRSARDLAEEFELLRRGNLLLFRSLDDEAAARSVVASNNPISTRALVWVIAGHERHHAKVLRERYLA
jgi:uncharacterized damage-inducible protein DinB